MNKTTRLPSVDFYDTPKIVMAIAHGAGASVDSDPMKQWVIALDDVGISGVRFEFPHTQQRRSG